MDRCFEATSGLFLGLVVLDGQVDQRHVYLGHDLTEHRSRKMLRRIQGSGEAGLIPGKAKFLDQTDLRASGTERDGSVGMWAGVDVGGRRKGFHIAVVTSERVAELKRCATPEDVVRALPTVRLVAIDSPRGLAPPGESARPCERQLARAVCGIRWTPDRIVGNRYYEWIAHGLELYSMLPSAVECFPTASWTRWAGPRRGSRAVWTTGALPLLGLTGMPPRTGQDFRDAIAAAVTARWHDEGRTESFGPIVVPYPGARLSRVATGAMDTE